MMLNIPPWHPVANKFPVMDDEEFRALQADIATRGQRKPIALYQGLIWDGRARAQACRNLGIQPRLRLLRRREEPAGYLVARHQRFGEPQSAERRAAVEILHQVYSDPWAKESARLKSEWIADARKEFALFAREWRPCAACGKHVEFVHAHHLLPLSTQYDLGLVDAVHDHEFLCPTHHRVVHIYIGIYITATADGTILDGVPEQHHAAWLACEAIFRKGLTIFEAAGGLSHHSWYVMEASWS